MNDIKVSVLVPTFNVELCIEECLYSLVSQTLRDIEIIIVDDCSTDHTVEIVERYATADGRIRLVNQDSHQGIAFTRNVCLSLARGKYITFVNSNDWISAEALNLLFIKAEKNQVDIILGGALYYHVNGIQTQVGNKSSVFIEEKAIAGQICLKRMLQTSCYIPKVCGNLYRTEFIREYQLHFEGYYHEDEYFTPYAFYYARQIIYSKEDCYRQHADSIVHRNDILKKRAESLSFISDQLQQFIKEHIKQMKGDIQEILQIHAETLCKRSQNLYEKELHVSEKKCLFIFSEESIAACYGIGTYIRQLLQCFDMSEWNVNVITLHKQYDTVKFKIKNEVAYYDFPVPQEKFSFDVSMCEEKYHKSIFYYLASRLKPKQKVYCHFNFSNHYQLARKFKKQLSSHNIFTLHYTNWGCDLLGDKEWLKRILSHPMGKKEHRMKESFKNEKVFMLECCDRIIAISNYSYDMLHQLYEIPLSKLAYIPNGLQDNYKERDAKERCALRTKYGFTQKEKIIIFAGRLDFGKGIIELIEAFKQVLEIFPKTRLVIAGTGNFTQCLKVAFPCWKHITFTGFIDAEKLYELYAISNIGVIPSLYEEFGYVAAEMMLNKLPIVVHAVTGLNEITDNGKYGIPFYFDTNKNIVPLKDAIIKALSGKQLDQEIIKGRDRILDNYSMVLFRKRIKSVYACMENPYSMFNNNNL